MAKSYVLTNRKKLDAFMRAGGQINDMGMTVGQLSGKPKYPRGHVGRRSRQRDRAGKHVSTIKPEEKDRRLQMRRARIYLNTLPKESRKAALKQLRAQLKGKGRSTAGLGRRRFGAVAVAKVAGIIASREQYHLRAMRYSESFIQHSLDGMRKSLLGYGKSVAVELTDMGRGLKSFVRRSLRATNHKDTGRMLRNTLYEIYTKGGKARVLRAAKEERARIRAAKKARKR